MGDLRHRIQFLRKPLLLLLQLLSSLISVIQFLRAQLCFILIKLKCQVFYNKISCPALQSTSFKQTSNRRGAKEKEGNGNSGAEKGVGYGDFLCLPDTCATGFVHIKYDRIGMRTLTLCLHYLTQYRQTAPLKPVSSSETIPTFQVRLHSSSRRRESSQKPQKLLMKFLSLPKPSQAVLLGLPGGSGC